MDSTDVNGFYTDLWAHPAYGHGLSLDYAFSTIEEVDIRGRRLGCKRKPFMD